jgi:hypothetical protein
VGVPLGVVIIIVGIAIAYQMGRRRSHPDLAGDMQYAMYHVQAPNSGENVRGAA